MFLTGLWFNSRIEKLKSELQEKPVQTGFADLQQERAKVVEELFELLISVERCMHLIEKSVEKSNKIPSNIAEKLGRTEWISQKDKENYLNDFVDSYTKLVTFYSKKRIFLDEDICRALSKINDSLSRPISLFLMFATFQEKQNVFFTEKETKYFLNEMGIISAEEVSTAIKITEKHFREMLFGETRDNRLNKK